MPKVSFLSLSSVALTLVFGLSLASSAAMADQAKHSRALITSAVDENSRVTLEGNTRPEANAQNDRGILADNFALEHLQLLLHRPPEQELALQQFIEELHEPSSPNYHQWLTADQFGSQYGVAKEDIAAISAWLTGHGFKVNSVYTSGMVDRFFRHRRSGPPGLPNRNSSAER